MRKEMELKELIERRGYSLRSFAEKINLPYTTLISMLNVGINKSSVDNVLKVYNGLGITIEELEDNSMRKLREAVEELEDHGFHVEVDIEKNFEIIISKDDINDFYNIYEFIYSLPASLERYVPNESKAKTGISVPLIGQVAAGIPILAEENIEEYFNIDSSIKANFCLRVKGDSMIDAHIYSDDIVFLRSQPTLENGEIGAVILNGEATLKRFYKDNGSIILQPENKEYKPIIISSGDVHIAGKLVAVLSLM